MFSFSFPKFRVLVLCGLLTASVAATSRAQTVTPGTFSAQEQAQSLVARGVEAFERGRLDEANRVLRESLMRANTPEAYFWMGRIHATRAQSSPEDKRTAIDYFRRALTMQPYGEEGELTRGWLLRLGGRPRVMHAIAAGWSQNHNRGDTKDLIGYMSTSELKRDYSIVSSNRDETDGKNLTTEELEQFCLAEDQTLTSGWLVRLSVESLETEYSPPKGDGSGYYHGSSTGQMQLFDPISKTLRETIPISSTSLEKSRSEAAQKALFSLSRRVWEQCRIVIGANPNATFLDETTFPSRLPGVYGRAAVPYDVATSLPLLALTACGTQDKAADQEGIDAARVLSADLQSELLKGGSLAVISPGGMRSALSKIGAADASFDVPQVCAAARATGARYALVSRLTQFDVYMKDQLISKKVVARAQLNVVLLDAQTEEALLTRKYEEKLGVRKWFASDSTSAITDKRVEALKRVRQSAAKDILAIIAAPNASSVAASPTDKTR